MIHYQSIVRASRGYFNPDVQITDVITPSSGNLLTKLTPVYRNLTDLHLSILSSLAAYYCTLYRYSVKMTEYKDKTKTLIETLTNIKMYIDFPGEVPNLYTYASTLAVKTNYFIEDLLPIMATFPWKYSNNKQLNVDIWDEFEMVLTDEFGLDHTLRFEITERRSDFIKQHLFREFVCVPVRVDSKDLTVNASGNPKDANIEKGKATPNTIYTEYD